MVVGKEVSSDKLEWRINVNDGTWEELMPESGIIKRVWQGVKGPILQGLVLRIWKFFEKAWDIAAAEPKKAIHGIKVGVALTIVSLFYYMRPLYEGVGGNAMWAVMTVVVVFEYTVGATLCKCINRATGTFLAGALGVGVHWVATQSGDQLEPIILGISVFLFASGATFSRFMPSVKARFDYGAMIFILTFSLVSVSGYRVGKLFEMAYQRLSTIAIGTSLCIFISMVCCPIWAGEELHSLIHRNLQKLADSLDGCVVGCFTKNSEEDKQREGYKCVLNSKATEDSMANFARWEPAHGRFNFRHPWQQYLKVGTSLRSCAYCIETLNSCITSDIQAPDYLKKHLGGSCMSLSSHASDALRELAITVQTMTKSSKIDLSIGEMQLAVQELQTALKFLPNHFTAKPSSTLPPIIEVLPLATLVSLLTEIAARIEEIADTVDELANMAEFKPEASKKAKQNQNQQQDQPGRKLANQNQPGNRLSSKDQDHQTVKTPQEV